MRGEDSRSIKLRRFAVETPPHARGRHLLAQERGNRLRNTPACAGKTFLIDVLLDCVGKHPRMRGEDALIDHYEDAEKETPPHARGRLPCLLFLLLFFWKHPRMRGEDAVCS